MVTHSRFIKLQIPFNWKAVSSEDSIYVIFAAVFMYKHYLHKDLCPFTSIIVIGVLYLRGGLKNWDGIYIHHYSK